jgi:putative sugar O-methyltransferase
MKEDALDDLLQEYKNAPTEFRATSYWESYEKNILDTIRSIDLNQLRSGKYPILTTFGFNDSIYIYRSDLSFLKKSVLSFVHRYVIKDRPFLPYRLKISDIQELAYRHCELMAALSNSTPIGAIEVSTFGGPKDLFEMKGRKYTMQFLGYYLRYCFSQKHICFKGGEILVELGSGSGFQIEILKKLYPNMTVLCFDLPGQIFLAEKYLAQALGQENTVGTDVTLKWRDLSGIKRGAVHFFGSWQIPLLEDFKFDVFWNAASFGEMEPDVVENYLRYIKGNAGWIYLLQARHGKEATGRTHVKTPITFNDYQEMLSGYVLQEEQDAWQAHRRLWQSGGYFEGVWKNGEASVDKI